MNSTENEELLVRPPQNAQELADLVQTTISELQEKFERLNDSILTQVGGMSRRIDELEWNVTDLVAQSNAESP